MQSGEPGVSTLLRNVVVGIERAASSAVVQCQPWLYLRLVSYGFFSLSEGHTVYRETRYRTSIWSNGIGEYRNLSYSTDADAVSTRRS